MPELLLQVMVINIKKIVLTFLRVGVRNAQRVIFARLSFFSETTLIHEVTLLRVTVLQGFIFVLLNL